MDIKPSNIFLSLARKLFEFESKTDNGRPVTEPAIAVSFLAAVLGRDWCERAVIRQTKYDKWMQNRLDPEGVEIIVWGSRLIRLTNALWTLIQANVVGFDVLRKRFYTRPTKPCFIETEIAACLSFNGFRVEIVAESGTRGKDFDLVAAHDEITLSVEVTGKEDGPLTASTIMNTMKKKKRQIPDDKPAVLYMHVPASWMQEPQEAQKIFNEAFNEFFRSSHRLNGVILLWEEVVPFVGGGNARIEVWPCYNNHPKNPFTQWHLLNFGIGSDGTPHYTHSFYDWLKTVQNRYAAELTKSD